MTIDRERREIICGNLEELLKFLFWTNSDLAHEMCVSPSIVYSWKVKKYIPRESTWKNMKLVCELRSEYLYGNANAVNPAFDIPNVTVGDLLRWQIEALANAQVLKNIGS